MTRRTSADGRALNARVREAIAFLRAHAPGHAEAVEEYVTAHRRGDDVQGPPNLSFKVHPDSWTQAQEADEQATVLVNEGIRLFLAGQFRPGKPGRVAGGRISGNARVADDVREAVATYAARHADQLGWTPTVRHVAAAWIEARFPPRT